MKRETVPNYLNGVTDLLILRLLKNREMYGYKLVEGIRTATGEARLDTKLTPDETLVISYTGQLASSSYQHGFNQICPLGSSPGGVTHRSLAGTAHRVRR